jgi:hypothetical protein
MNRNHPTYPWRAGCDGSRKSGSADGGEETTGRNAGTGASPPIQRLVGAGGDDPSHAKVRAAV